MGLCVTFQLTPLDASESHREIANEAGAEGAAARLVDQADGLCEIVKMCGYDGVDFRPST
jgi:hypothetical protein